MGKHINALRAARLQAVAQANAVVAQQARAAARNQRKSNAVQVRTQAYMLAVQQLAVKMGVPVPNTLSVRSVANAQVHAPSTQSGACAKVHALAAANNYVRAATLQACAAAGINPATAATQYAVAKRNALAAQAVAA